MIQGTITLRRKQEEPVETPRKKDAVRISVDIEGKHYDMDFYVPLSTSLVASQKTHQSLTDLFTLALSRQFGRVTRL